jgi:hypothetical protein
VLGLIRGPAGGPGRSVLSLLLVELESLTLRPPVPLRPGPGSLSVPQAPGDWRASLPPQWQLLAAVPVTAVQP